MNLPMFFTTILPRFPKSGCFLMLLFSFSSGLLAQSHQFQPAGLPRGVGAFDMIEDPDGWIWFTTARGLFRYDGVAFTLFEPNGHPGTPETASSQNLERIYRERTGQLWVSSTVQGLYSFEHRTGNFSALEAYAAMPGPVRISALAGDHQTLWIATMGAGLSRMDLQTRHFYYYQGHPNLSIEEMLADTRALLLDPTHLWIGTRKALLQLETKTDTFVELPLKDPQATPPQSIQALLQRESLWLGCANGLFRLGLSGIESVILNLSVQPTQIHALSSDQQGRLWIACEQGLICVDDPEQTMQARLLDPITHLDESVTPTLSEPIQSILVDQTNTLWIGTKTEVFKTNVNQPTKQTVAADQKTQSLSWLLKWGVVLVCLGLALLFKHKFSSLSSLQPKKKVDYQRQGELLQLGILKEEYLANAGRQIHRPVSEINEAVLSLLEENHHLDVNARASLGLILSNGKLLHSLVSNIQDLSSLPLSGHPHDRVDLYRLVQSAQAGALESQPSQSLEIYNEVSPNFIPVRGEPNRLTQILRHLFTFLNLSPKGIIRVRAEQLNPQAPTAQVSVIHENQGQEKELLTLAHAAVSAARGHLASELTTPQLGLAIAARLLALEGIILSLTGDKNQLCFHFALPVGEDKTGQEKLTYIPLHPEPIAEYDRGETQILIVDQDEVARRLAATYIQEASYQVEEVASAAEALALLSGAFPYSLVLIELDLPKKSGIQVCREIRRRFSKHDLPILIMAHPSQVPDIRGGFQAGVSDFIAKPLGRDILIARLELHIRLREVSRDLENLVAKRTQDLEQRNQEIVRRQSQLIVQAKMASLGTLTAGIAHEIKNPLNFVTNFAEINAELAGELRETLFQSGHVLPESARSDLDILITDLEQNTHRILVHSRRASQIVFSMADVTSEEHHEVQDVLINMLVDEFVNMAYQVFMTKYKTRIQLEKSYDNKVGTYLVAPQSLSRVIVNLMNNAIEAVLARKEEEKDGYEPFVWVSTHDAIDQLEITIRDNGTGIATEYLDRIFNPFFTTKPQGTGHIGLGLYLSYDIVVHQHQGRLLINSSDSNGCEFKILLPKKSLVNY